MIYRKRGAVVRYENGVLVRVVEAGEAIEEGALFRCYPVSAAPLPLPPDPQVPRYARDDVGVERLIVSNGVAEHETNGITWSEETHRVHAALTKGKLRALVDRAADIEPIADALARAEEQEREQPPRLVLAPNVSAALLPILAVSAPPNVDVRQTAGGRDGYGQLIEETSTNWYRPSYRVRPVRMPFNLRATCAVTAIEPDRPRAVALLAPVTGLVLRVLVDDGARVYPSTVRVTRIDAIADEAIWYPFGAGSFGAEMML